MAVKREPEEPRAQFKAFYEPLLPALQASYANVRFRSAHLTRMRSRVQAIYYRGTIGVDGFVVDKLNTTWIPERSFKESQLPKKLDIRRGPIQSGGTLPDCTFRVNDRLGIRDLHVDFERTPLFVLPVHAVAPTWSVQLGRTYAQIMEDPDVTFVDFTERRSRSGERFRTVFYTPAGYAENYVFEADFDPITGVCVSALEFVETSTGTIVEKSISVVYDDSPDSDSRYLPAPVKIEGDTGFADWVSIFHFERVDQLGPDEVSVVAYGFDESRTQKPVSVVSKITTSLTQILMVILVVLSALLISIVLLAMTISFVAKRRRKELPEEVSEKLPDDPTSETG